MIENFVFDNSNARFIVLLTELPMTIGQEPSERNTYISISAIQTCDTSKWQHIKYRHTELAVLTVYSIHVKKY